MRAQSIRRIGEVERAIGTVDEVVGTVQLFALVAVDQNRDLRVRVQVFETVDVALRVPGNDDAILRWNRCVRLLQDPSYEWEEVEQELVAFDAHDAPPR